MDSQVILNMPTNIARTVKLPGPMTHNKAERLGSAIPPDYDQETQPCSRVVMLMVFVSDAVRWYELTRGMYLTLYFPVVRFSDMENIIR